jgi:hypothetical protein
VKKKFEKNKKFGEDIKMASIPVVVKNSIAGKNFHFS